VSNIEDIFFGVVYFYSVLVKETVFKNLLQSLIKLKLCVCLTQVTDAPDVVVLDVLSLFIGSCVWSISQSDVQTVDQAILAFSWPVEITSIFSVEITRILNEQLLIIICPGQPMCSGHGVCDAGLCVCDSGNNFNSYICACFCRFSPQFLKFNLSLRRMLQHSRMVAVV